MGAAHQRKTFFKGVPPVGRAFFAAPLWRETEGHMATKELREKRHKSIVDARALHEKAKNEKRELTPEEMAQFEAMIQEVKDLTARIDALEKQAGMEAELDAAESGAADSDAAAEQNSKKRDDELRRFRSEKRDDKPVITHEQRSRAFRAWVKAGSGHSDLREEELEAAKQCGINIGHRFLRVRLRSNAPRKKDMRAQSAQDGSTGGLLVPSTLSDSIESALLAFGGIREVATVRRTSDGGDFTFITGNDTSNEGTIVGENTLIADATNLSFGSITLRAHKYTSLIVKVPTELLNDSIIDLPGYIGDMLGERVARITNRHFTTGVGGSQPTGIVTASTLGVTAASATAITPDEVLALRHSVDPAYRDGASWMFHDSVLLFLLTLKGGDGQYYWTDGMRDGDPDLLFGAPTTVNQHMASSLAASAKVMLYGQMAKYIVRDVADITIERLDERYAEYGQVAFVALSRHDGNLLDAGTHPVKYLQMNS